MTLSPHASDLLTFARTVWAWRDREAFRSDDDVQRFAHPPEWTPTFSRADIDRKRLRLAQLRDEWTRLDLTGAPVPVQVDYRLIGTVLARARWELDVTRSWERDANFLVGQLVGPYFDLLLPPPPFDDRHQRCFVRTLNAVPSQVAIVRENLSNAGTRELAHVALEMLDSIADRLTASTTALLAHLDPSLHSALRSAADRAGVALTDLAHWLADQLDTFGPLQPVGRDSFRWYLRHVALMPEEPEQLIALADQEYNRATVWEQLAAMRVKTVPTLATSIEAQCAQERLDEQEIRDFYENNDLLSQGGYARYLVHPLPDYLAPLQRFGVNDDLTDVHRVGAHGRAYAPVPAEGLPFFTEANARDPRLGIIHEGAHFQQLVRAWDHEDEIRRHYYDSAANEGIAFYDEELMVQAGLFDASAYSRHMVYTFSRLRALRVIVDLKLATGDLDLPGAVEVFTQRVGMDRDTASDESAYYIANPGFAMTYLIGKLQLMGLFADAIEARPDGTLSTREFHDWVWKNGNLPFSLLRWELLGDASHIDEVDRTRPAW